jgi:hypothetical protein
MLALYILLAGIVCCANSKMFLVETAAGKCNYCNATFKGIDQ